MYIAFYKEKIINNNLSHLEKKFIIWEVLGHKAALKINQEAQKEKLETLKTLTRKKDITCTISGTGYKVVNNNQSVKNSEDKKNVQ